MFKLRSSLGPHLCSGRIPNPHTCQELVLHPRSDLARQHLSRPFPRLSSLGRTQEGTTAEEKECKLQGIHKKQMAGHAGSAWRPAGRLRCKPTLWKLDRINSIIVSIETVANTCTFQCSFNLMSPYAFGLSGVMFAENSEPTNEPATFVKGGLHSLCLTSMI
jgi:hypothetical protein